MDFINLAEMFFKFFMNQHSSIGQKSQEISVEILNQVRRVLILVIITTGALILFCMGMSHLIERVLNKLDEGGFFFSTSIAVLLLFIVICIGVMIYSTRKSVWMGLFKKELASEAKPQAEGQNSLETVITLLVMDFIKEREYSRENRATGPVDLKKPETPVV